MAERVGLCEITWNEAVHGGNQLISCPSELFLFQVPAAATVQPGFFAFTSPVATCATGFSQIVSGASHQLTCPESDFAFISRFDFQVQPSADTSQEDTSGSMSSAQYEGLWFLVFIIGLVVAFGLGAIKGGQR